MVESDEVIQEISIPELITVKELAESLNVSAIEIIKELMKNGVMATINQVIDFDTAAIIVADLGYNAIEKNNNTSQDNNDEEDYNQGQKFLSLRYDSRQSPDASSRNPVITVLGHVDHGKTTLLDRIRKSNLVDNEAGNITQNIAAYQAISPDGRSMTFIDTPGHAAFTKMRMRGAQITDVAIIVIAADDGVMPQTKEAIEYVKSASIPMIAAINKTDLKDISIDRIKQQLMEIGLTPEEYGGDLVVLNISATTGAGVDELLETTQLIADLQELKASINDPAEGIILEAKMHKNQGILTTLIVQNGTLNQGDIIVTDSSFGKIKSMTDDSGKKINSAGPSTPLIISGLSVIPQSGEKFKIVTSEKEAKKISNKVQRNKETVKKTSIIIENKSLDEEENIKYLNLIIKSDTQGSIEPIINTIETLKNDSIGINIIDSSIGSINEADVSLASISKSAILGFNSKAEIGAQKLAEKEGVVINSFDIIYDLHESIEQLINDTLGPIITITEIGKVEVRKLFIKDKTETIAGSYVSDGKISRGDKVKIIRDELEITTSTIESIRRESDEVNEVNAGIECGVKLTNFNNFEENDLIIAYTIKEEKRQI